MLLACQCVTGVLQVCRWITSCKVCRCLTNALQLCMHVTGVQVFVSVQVCDSYTDVLMVPYRCAGVLQACRCL